MGYSSFSNLKKVVQNFGITIESTSFFEDSEIQRIIPSDWLIGTIERANYLGFDSEKERSERLDKNLQIHQTLYYTKEVDFLLGVLQFVLDDCKK